MVMVDQSALSDRGSAVALAPGDEFAGYTIESTLGTGGMGAVYLAKHPRLPRRDALKLLNPAFSADANFRTRFEREADLASGLIHRNIVAVYDRGSVDGQLWIAMQHLTGTGNLLATLAYASPEQIEAKPLDHRVDIYALGCVLYELLTGSVPFPESSPFATMTAHLKNPPPRPTNAMPWLPAGFDAVVAKAMAKNPDDRYSTCRELSLAARAALAASAPAASDPTRAETAPPPAARAGAAGSADGPAAVPGAASSIAAPGGPGAAPAQADAAAVAAASISLTAPRPPY